MGKDQKRSYYSPEQALPWLPAWPRTSIQCHLHLGHTEHSLQARPTFPKLTHTGKSYLTLNITGMMGVNKWHSIWRQNITCSFLFLPAFLVQVLRDREHNEGLARNHVQKLPPGFMRVSTHTGGIRLPSKNPTWSRIRAASWAVCSRGVSVRVYFDLVAFQSLRYLI